VSDRTRFILTALAVATVLFLVWAPVSAFLALLMSHGTDMVRALFGAGPVSVAWEKHSYSLIPVLALMAAARAVSPNRRLAFIAATIGLFLALETLAYASGIHASRAARAGNGRLWETARLIYHAVELGLPLAMAILFAGGSPALLWEKQAKGKRPR